MSFEVRLAALADAPRCAEIHARSWLFAYSDGVPMEIIEKQNARWPFIWPKMLEKNTDASYVIQADGVAAGFLTINPARDGDLADDVYEVIGLYLDPAYIGKGYGSAAMDWAKEAALSRGYGKLSLWVLEENTRARAFYEKKGFQPDGAVKASGLGDTKEVRYICPL